MIAAGPRAVPSPRRAREVTLVVNPHASHVGADGPALARDALRAAGAAVDVAVTQDPDELARVLVAARGGRAVLLGGDGTLHAAANCPPPLPELALIPAGAANNVARCLGIPTAPAEAARLAVTGAARPVDAIEAVAGGRRLIAVEGVSVGFLALARARYHAENSSDVRAALAAGAAALAGFHPLEVRIGCEGCPGAPCDACPELMHVVQLFVANMPCYGTGLRVAPGADPADGLLDLVAIDGHGRADVPAMLVRLRRGTHLGRPGVLLRRARAVHIDGRGRSPVIADSEDLGTGAVTVRALPGILPIVAPVR
jgi:diacylglycerol kinase (ATP)